MVDRLLTEALMTEFVRLGMILSEDLVANLRAYRTEVKESCETLFQNMEATLSHFPCEAVRGLLVAVGRCNTQVRLSLIYIPGQPPRPPVPGIL